MASNEPTNFMDASNKGFVLDVLEREIATTFAEVADPGRWEAPTACAGWQVRDVIGHLCDATEGYFPNWDIALNGGSPPEPYGLRAMMRMANDNALAFRKVGREEMLDRLRDDAATMMGHLRALSDEQWGGLMVHHPYIGPLPAMFYAMFQLVDYTVHSWDIREGTGDPHGMNGDAADLLVPVIYVLWQATCDVSGVTEPFSVGIRVSGRNGGDTRANFTNEGVQFAPGSLDGCAATLEFDPASMVLTAYGRINTGTVRGESEVAARFRSLFFPI
jgi:uncharacterized protein (TIGR03083 family)